MATFRQVGDDLDKMARYWELRKFQYLEEASMEFELLTGGIPEPENMDLEFQKACNCAFTEWLIFERVLWSGQTPFELYAAAPPKTVCDRAATRLRDLCATQFFSAFKVTWANPATGRIHARDIFSGKRFSIMAPHVARQRTWLEGTVYLRIGRTADTWFDMTRLHFHDRCEPEEEGPRKMGAIRPEDDDIKDVLEDMGFYLRFIRDVFGCGAYQPSELNFTSLTNEAAA